MDQFPSNSSRRPPRQSEVPKAHRVVQGDVIQQKPPLGRRISHNLLGGDVRSVWSYVFGDIVAPAFRDLVADTVSGGVERMLFGEASSTRRRRSSGPNNHVPYNRMTQGRNPRNDSRSMTSRARANHDFDEIIIPSRAEAMEVLDRLGDMIEKYDGVTVGNLYEMVGLSSNYMDDKWGWTDLSMASVSRERNGYLLNLPKPEPLD